MPLPLADPDKGDAYGTSSTFRRARRPDDFGLFGIHYRKQ